MKKKILEKNKGITLIALVITIIVLLILAGISISMLAGDNSLLKKAGEAKDKTELESLKEEAKIVMSNRTIEKITMGTYSKTLKQDLESGISGGQVEEITKADGTTKYTDVCYVSKNGQSITVYEDGEVEEGKVSIWKGTTDIECPKYEKDEKNIWNWYIYTPSQLKFLADFVNNGNKLEGRDDLKKLVEDANYDTKTVTMSTDTTIYLMNNLDLGARQTNGELIAGESWTPIGGQNQLIAKFEGNNHTIRGVYVQGGNFTGIFGYSSDINYLTVKNSYIKGQNGAGGIVGASTGEINNCHNINTLVIGTGTFVGGIAGRTLGTEINACSNSGVISGENNNVGGIVGESSGTISGCKNSGTIKGANQIGGIVGRSTNTINDCNNSGGISGTNDSVGGIVGNSSGTISSCNNSGALNAKNYVGGIVGAISKTINDCNNSGSINAKNYVGGIVGYSTGTISSCNNSGAINGEIQIGGIAGQLSNTINDCNNSGKINGANLIGGIVGKSSNIINNCNNSGVISGTNDFVGGIVGVSTSTISGCDNSGAITGTGSVGGIAGVARTITKCSNTGNISGTGTTGGIVGTTEKMVGQDISLCYNSGEVKGANTVGGISGYLGAKDQKGKEYKCYNKGKVINTSNANSTGGIVGKMATDASVTNCYYLSSIGVDRGIGTINTQEQNDGAQPTEKDINSFEEFITWIEQQNT